MRKANSKFSFYTIDEKDSKWYFDGKTITENEESCAIFASDAPKEWLKENYKQAPMYKKLVKLGLKDKEIMIEVF